MESLPLSLLAFAAGVYLLVKVKKEYLGDIFSVLAWFVIAASAVSIGFSSVECYEECFECCDDEHEYHIEKKIMIKEGEKSCHHMSMDDCCMGGCKMKGDSCVMDKEACEKLMGKKECDKMSKERGRCIMSKEECEKFCHPGCVHKGEGEMKNGKRGCVEPMKEGEGKCGHH